MPRPKSDREAWQEELKELTALFTKLHRELHTTPGDAKERREELAWKIKRAERRMAELRARLQGVENG